MDRIELDAEDKGVMTLRFPVSVQPGRVVVEIDGLSKSYGENQILDNLDLLIERGNKIAFVGQNGQGKTTLARIIVGDLDATGTCRLGHNVQLGYFAQNQAEYLDGEKTVLDTMIDAANEQTRPRVRDILGAFLFRGEEVDKPVKVLSGGERNRLALAKMLLQPFNVLVMDEPTNHLDIPSKRVLKDALANFEGTLILVSHDRDFLQGLTNVVYEFRNKGIKPYLGDIDFYLEQRNAETFRTIELGDDKANKKAAIPNESNGSVDFEVRKRQKSLKNKLGTLEGKIAELEKEISEMDYQLHTNYDETAAKPEFFDRYQSKKNQLSVFMKDWEQLSEELESLS
jgi:ATP-binding cassette subfamily F protein 3